MDEIVRTKVYTENVRNKLLAVQRARAKLEKKLVVSKLEVDAKKA